MSNSDFPAKSGTQFRLILPVCVCIQYGTDGDNGDGDGNGDGNGNSTGNGVGDSDYCTRSTLTRMLATSTSAMKLPQTLSLLLAKASTALEPSISQSFHKLRVFDQPKASCGKPYSSRVCSYMLDAETCCAVIGGWCLAGGRWLLAGGRWPRS